MSDKFQNVLSYNDSTAKPTKKRMRVPTSCSICRRRKIKCDKKKPCSGCKKSGVSQLCVYEEPSWFTNESQLKSQQQQQEGEIDNEINNNQPQTQTQISQQIKPQVSVNQPFNNQNNNNNNNHHHHHHHSHQSQHHTSSLNENLNIDDLPTSVKFLIEELQSRVKHLEASIAVHDLSTSFNHSSSNRDSAQRSTSNIKEVAIQQQQQANQKEQLQPKEQLPQKLPLPLPQQHQQNQQPSDSIINYNNNKTFENDSLFKSYPKIELLGFDPNSEIDLMDYVPFLIRNQRLQQLGALSIGAHIRKDIYLKMLWGSIFKNFHFLKNLSDEAKSNTASFGEIYSKISLNWVFEIKKLKKEVKERQLKLKNSTIPLDQLILENLPSKKICINLIKNFFQNFYPYLPFINERQFIEDLKKNLNFNYYKDFEDDSKFESIDVINFKYSYATLGILLVILKLSYLSLSNEQLKSNDFKLNSSNHSNYIDLARKCLFEYNFLQKTYTLRIIQLILLIKSYSKYGNEDEDSWIQHDTQITLGLLFSMAYQVGLNRDPLILVKLRSQPSFEFLSFTQTWRKIWYQLLEMDVNQSITLGSPLLYHEINYDTNLPSLDNNNDNDNDEMDQWIIEDFKLVHLKTQLLKEVGITISNYQKKPSIIDILKLIKKLEVFSQEKIGNISKILADQSLKVYAKTKKIIYILEIDTLLLNLNSILWAHFEKFDNSKQIFIYLNECLNLCLKIHNSIINIMFNETKYFQNDKTTTSNLVIRPLSSLAIARCFLILTSFVCKILHSVDILQNNSKKKTINKDNGDELILKNNIKLTKLNQLSLKIFNILENLIQIIVKISKESFNLSKIERAFKFMYHELKDSKVSYLTKMSKIIELESDKFGPDDLLFHDLSNSVFPKSNFTLNLLDSELDFLISKFDIELPSILKPINKNSNNNDNNNENQIHGITNLTVPLRSVSTSLSPSSNPNSNVSLSTTSTAPLASTSASASTFAPLPSVSVLSPVNTNSAPSFPVSTSLNEQRIPFDPVIEYNQGTSISDNSSYNNNTKNSTTTTQSTPSELFNIDLHDIFQTNDSNTINNNSNSIDKILNLDPNNFNLTTEDYDNIMLYLIGLGLSYEDDITVRGLNAVKKCKRVYLEAYTSILMAADKESLEKFYGREIILADRELVESGSDIILENGQEDDIAFLVVGDPFGATTHTDLLIRARELGIKIETIHNASVMNAVGACGLQLYNFGQTVSLVFFTDNWRPDSFYDKILENRKIGLHTLVLLDIKVKEQSIENMARGRLIYEPPRYMNIETAASQLLEIEEKRNQQCYTENTPAVAISRLGSPNQTFKAATLKQLTEFESGEPLHSLIILGRQVHDLELEFLYEYVDNKEEFKQHVINDQEFFKPPPYVPPEEDEFSD
ncbi:hypothetical protein WICMUC_003349 [Wickerhamomyces mucosus]|uniref:diphthine methyl ester synthase n=1 Tax=Wickerhamomyces mucosus TaxID=1378264 RepID=A0A9P8PND7_9ASCO|nr:hypothetical protein WICMUC_003349 [Wickerhamomyces mucosus]